ncbi:MAG: DUF4037 domain-containing protein [Oscillospiraceae bacterium]|nr:DUF4037 domain-containing protein [Oscillospiraceae bacterium]
MDGLELSKGYFEECGKPMLEKDFADVLSYIAVGFVGSGSEHLGYDDEISQDHDFEPGFCIFLPSEEQVDRRTAFLLERAYEKLPKEYMGFKRQKISPVGGNRNGVLRTAEFYLSKTGTPDGILSNEAWLSLPDYALLEATNGEIYFDNFGEFTKIRSILKNQPSDIRLKKLAGNLLIMAQAGQYNFTRCLNHGEKEAAQIALFEFVNAAMKTVFLLNNRYMPYYKWSFRALREFDADGFYGDNLSLLLYGDNNDFDIADLKYEAVEKIAGRIIDTLQEQNLTKAICGDLEKHAYSVNDKISDGTLRNLNILAGI